MKKNVSISHFKIFTNAYQATYCPRNPHVRSQRPRKTKEYIFQILKALRNTKKWLDSPSLSDFTNVSPETFSSEKKAQAYLLLVLLLRHGWLTARIKLSLEFCLPALGFCPHILLLTSALWKSPGCRSHYLLQVLHLETCCGPTGWEGNFGKS